VTQSKSIKIELARGDLTAKNMDIIVNLFEVPPGTTVPKHTHPGEEIVYVIDDGGTLREPSGILVTTPVAAPFGFAFTPKSKSSRRHHGATIRKRHRMPAEPRRGGRGAGPVHSAFLRRAWCIALR
jgi:hypothetical protein